MADSEEVLAQVEFPAEVEIIGIIVNEPGAERAIATRKVTTLGFPCSVSSTFLRRNQNQSPTENEEVLRRIVERAREAKLEIVVYVSMAFGNPYGDPWSEGRLLELVQHISNIGVGSISLADTIGVAGPESINRVVSLVGGEAPGCDLGVHLHSTREEAAEKILAAYDAGCRRFDSAIGGLGGCPFAQNDLVGNIPTEEVFRALEQRGMKSPIVDALPSVFRENEKIARKFTD